MDKPIKVCMGANALDELRGCEYGSYEDHINTRTGEREEPYQVQEDGTYRKHIVELIQDSPYKTVVYLRTQLEVDEFFIQQSSGTFGLYHTDICYRVYEQLKPFVSDEVKNTWIYKSPMIGY